MRTLTLKISDDYFDKFVAFLEMMPKKSVKIETTDGKKEISLMQNSIKHYPQKENWQYVLLFYRVFQVYA